MSSPHPNSILETLRLALVRHQQGRLDEAEGLYRQVIQLEPGQHDAWRLLGVLFYQKGNLELARQFLEQSLQTPTVSGEAHHALGLVFEDLGRLDAAAAAYEKALKIRPGHPDTFLRLAMAQEKQGRFQEAESCLRKLLELDPNSALAHLKLASILEGLDKLEEAQGHAETAVRSTPEHAEACLCLGTILLRRNRVSDAVPHFNRAAQLDPLASAGAVPTLREVLQEGTRTWEKRLESDPADFEALLSLAKIRYTECKLAEAVELLERALACRPGEPNAEYALAFTELLLGRFEAGWKHYEARLRTGQREFPNRPFIQPRWTGDDLAGRAILVHAEQGIGDTIHFVRYLPLVAERGGRVILECQPQLKPLLRTFPSASDVVAQGQAFPPFDVQIPLLSLPGIFRTNLASIPNHVPYLKIPDGVHRELPAAAHGHLKIGLAWAGNPALQNDLVRSIPLAKLSRLFALPNVSFFSLQVGPASQQLALLGEARKPIDLRPLLNDFAQTAAVIQQLDLVISVDTAVAHLAGALAKPVWLLLPFVPEWRWLLDREDSPWYPSMRLFRQGTMEDWDNVVERLEGELQARNLSRN